MKIALLTFHNASNYGAALQAYALQQALFDMGYDNEYINYVNTRRANVYNMGYHMVNALFVRRDPKLAIKYLLGTPFMEVRSRRFKGFFAENLKFTEAIYRTSESARELNTRYDKFVVGSDQVWNPRHNGGDTAYLLDFVDDHTKKISYASSFGFVETPSEVKERYTTYLGQFSALSTREMSGVDVIKCLTGRDSKLVIDPLFLLSASRWRRVKRREFCEDYIFSYTNKGGQFEEFLKVANYDMRGLQHYKLASSTTVRDLLSPSTRVMYTMSPYDFVSAVDNARLVVTASFHCVALSIILNRDFVAVLTGDEGRDSRIVSLLEMMGLQHRILGEALDVNEPIDFTFANRQIQRYVEEAIDYLHRSIAK
ncbi:MAG: polysaccharide pyruvyl transferase family protein [Rikenellaceae bacterium]